MLVYYWISYIIHAKITLSYYPTNLCWTLSFDCLIWTFSLYVWSNVLRYYATFKVRKFESSFYKINPLLQKTNTCIGLRAKQIFLVNIKYTYFAILGMAFAVPFLCYFQKLQLLVLKKIWTTFCCIVLVYIWAQKVCLRFLNSYFKLEILIFLSFAVSFLVDIFN